MGQNVSKQDARSFGLYSKEFEHDNCGIGAVVDIKGRQTHSTVADALTIVETLEHRAGKDAEGKTGDGVGILTQISHRFFQKTCSTLGFSLPEEREYGIGMFFFPQAELARNQAKKMFEIIAEKEGLSILGWRQVPCNPDVLGKKAYDCMPNVMQCFIKKPDDVKIGLDFDRRLYIVRREFEQSNEDTYVVSLSSRTIVYKGMFLVDQLRSFFTDLQDQDYESAIALVHSRFSTNTNPSWKRAHPNRFMVHNGEINTIRGNADNMKAREENMESEHLKGDLYRVLPVINEDGSDSAMLDNTLEFLVMSGMPLPLAVMICIPEPWEHNTTMSQERKDFYHYHATMMEPWDGPASIIVSDGDLMGAVLDRNGLRPSRYYITDDDKLILSSEVGALEIAPEKIVKKDRLRPGKMLLVDTKNGRLIEDEEIKELYATKQPYGEWLDSNLVRLADLKIPNKKVLEHNKEERRKLQKVFGYHYEDLMKEILPMAQNGGEATAAMGRDIPLSVLSDKNHNLFSYFKQRFAQVTNPPIDAIREKVVTSTTLYLGEEGNILAEKPENCKVLEIKNPILTSTDLLKIKNMKVSGFQVAEISLLYYKNTSLEKAMEHLFVEADKAHKDGVNLLILSDRGVDENHVAIPSLLAVSGLHQYLVRTKKRTSLALILETAEPKGVHDFATLLGFGASAINPYLAQECIHELIDNNLLDKDYYVAVDDYNKAIISGVVKIASKMGISTIQSYKGSQMFEAVGLSDELVDKYFTHTVSRIGGLTMADIERSVDQKHSKAFDPLGLRTDNTLDSQGGHKERSGEEEHLYNPQTIYLLQQAVMRNDYHLYKQYSKVLTDDLHCMNLRGLMEFNKVNDPIPLDQVESVEEIVKRFKTGAMSYGSISKEAHECMAIAMNMLHGKSNSGEGGEEEDRLTPDPDGTSRCSAIKQVASGRFGVTSRYLNSAKEIQIKMAQGAKPGEGGHLPGKKVYPWIAKTRHSTPGVALISPPPHHDIYSIEDLAQLIYDLKNANRDARISVKLVSEAGVGTIAAGVAKAGAGVILISGFDGGTGAAPLNSIHNAGLPWELGLAEAHQTLIYNDLRDRVVIEADGKLMNGRDVAIAALLGAEEFGFATAPLVTMGCVMMRVCNLDTCPAGVATQNPELRKRFNGKPEYIVNFMKFIAQDLREHMAELGFASLDEMVGRVDCLKRKEGLTGKPAEVDISGILYDGYKDHRVTYLKKDLYDFELESRPDVTILEKKFKKALSTRFSGSDEEVAIQKEEFREKTKAVKVKLTNTDRSFGTIFGSDITKTFGEDSLLDDTFVVECEGAGGQSFGAFIPKGLTLRLTGDSNDYFGKGLSGGKLVLMPPAKRQFKEDENIIVGNVALYGATSGSVYINGIAGERFCVRNSGATAVVEGVGDHGCEYMTGGRAVILGATGKNFAAGMSGGIVYVLDEDHKLYTRINKELVKVSEVTEKKDLQDLKQMIEEHYEATGSSKAKKILDNFLEESKKFKKIIPYDYESVMEKIAYFDEQTSDHQEALLEAFNAFLAEKQ